MNEPKGMWQIEGHDSKELDSQRGSQANSPSSANSFPPPNKTTNKWQKT